MFADHRILVLHGPNLNLLGNREPQHYGNVTLSEINGRLESLAGELTGGMASTSGDISLQVECRQTNAEHELVSWIQRAPDEGVGFIVINPAAFTHTSVAVRDALAAVGIPFIEVHLSNVHAREPFRRHSYLSDLAVGVIAGLGVCGYEYALKEAVAYLCQRH
ncbi:MAG: type II 3-dehydroquinate dehydratase [Gammaproteobacteria bacterium]|nr:type II 3-dehydroquinate dehydratase [Gammaproteobacteria bacterium]